MNIKTDCDFILLILFVAKMQYVSYHLILFLRMETLDEMVRWIKFLALLS